jgi:hypothetical protein
MSLLLVGQTSRLNPCHCDCWQIFGADDAIATAGREGLRLFAVQKNDTSTTEIDDLLDVQTPGGG